MALALPVSRNGYPPASPVQEQTLSNGRAGGGLEALEQRLQSDASLATLTEISSAMQALRAQTREPRSASPLHRTASPSREIGTGGTSFSGVKSAYQGSSRSLHELSFFDPGSPKSPSAWAASSPARSRPALGEGGSSPMRQSGRIDTWPMVKEVVEELCSKMEKSLKKEMQSMWTEHRKGLEESQRVLNKDVHEVQAEFQRHIWELKHNLGVTDRRCGLLEEEYKHAHRDIETERVARSEACKELSRTFAQELDSLGRSLREEISKQKSDLEASDTLLQERLMRAEATRVADRACFLGELDRLHGSDQVLSRKQMEMVHGECQAFENALALRLSKELEALQTGFQGIEDRVLLLRSGMQEQLDRVERDTTKMTRENRSQLEGLHAELRLERDAWREPLMCLNDLEARLSGMDTRHEDQLTGVIMRVEELQVSMGGLQDIMDKMQTQLRDEQEANTPERPSMREVSYSAGQVSPVETASPDEGNGESKAAVVDPTFEVIKEVRIEVPKEIEDRLGEMLSVRLEEKAERLQLKEEMEALRADNAKRMASSEATARGAGSRAEAECIELRKEVQAELARVQEELQRSGLEQRGMQNRLEAALLTTSEVASRFDELEAATRQVEAKVDKQPTQDSADEFHGRIEALETHAEKSKFSSTALPSLFSRLEATEAALGAFTDSVALPADLATRMEVVEDAAVQFQASAASLRELEQRLEAKVTSKSPSTDSLSQRLAELEELTYGQSRADQNLPAHEVLEEKSALAELRVSTEALEFRLSQLEAKVADSLGSHVGSLRMQLQEAMENASSNPVLGMEVQGLVQSHLEALEGALGDCRQALSSLQSSPREPTDRSSLGSTSKIHRVSFSDVLEAKDS